MLRADAIFDRIRHRGCKIQPAPPISDCVSVHAPPTMQTHGLPNAFRKMKKSAFRGNTVLFRALGLGLPSSSASIAPSPKAERIS
jgi:hypothetical protein